MTRQDTLRHRFKRYERLQAHAQRRINLFAVLRFALFLIIIAGLSFIVDGDYRLSGAITFTCASVAFLYLMKVHDQWYRYQALCHSAQDLIQDDLARVQGELAAIEMENPVQFDASHPFARDLDFTGENSVFKLLDNCFHDHAKSILKSWFVAPAPLDAILQRQGAVTELARKIRFRFKLSLYSRAFSDRDLDFAAIDAWLKQRPPVSLSITWLILGQVLAYLSTLALGAHFIFGMANVPWIPIAAIQFIAYLVLNQVQRPFIQAFMQIKPGLQGTARILPQIERLRPESELLQQQKATLSDHQDSASEALRRLQARFEFLQYRSNGLAHFLLNFLFQWDQFHLARLLKWEKRYGHRFEAWMEAVFTFEALASVANYAYLFPKAVAPELHSKAKAEFRATGLGHPLIHEDMRVCNDYSISHGLHLLTGSNMSGKSTFLRTIGVNWALAMAGAPVCAKELSCSLVRLWTSIRIQDSLSQGVSYFYAEVQRLKLILDGICHEGLPVFLLLDEILKGTNSRERLIASKALVQFLIEREACGVITTHDLELLELADLHPDHIQNFHFREIIEADKMSFDYRLRPDHLTSTNALKIMTHARLPLDFEAVRTGDEPDQT